MHHEGKKSFGHVGSVGRHGIFTFNGRLVGKYPSLTKSWGMCNENLGLFKVTFYVLPREITMKPPFGWIFFTFSKLGMQIQVNQ